MKETQLRKLIRGVILKEDLFNDLGNTLRPPSEKELASMTNKPGEDPLWWDMLESNVRWNTKNALSDVIKFIDKHCEIKNKKLT